MTAGAILEPRGLLVAELHNCCYGRDLSRAAFAELQRLTREGTEAELLGAIRHLRHLPIVLAGDVPVCAETTDLLLTLLADRAARQVEHRGRIRRAARFLGRKVARHEITLADAEHRLERLCERRDVEVATNVRLIPYPVAMRIAKESFTAAFRAHNQRVA